MTFKREKPVVMISDMHIDKWDKERKLMFYDFMDYVEKEASELFILGDMFDFPTKRGESIWPRHADIIMRLRALPYNNVPLTYIIGNHDISLRGIEFQEDGLAMVYADKKRPVIKNMGDMRIFMEHGHDHDPLFKQNVYAAVDFLKSITGKPLDDQALSLLKNMIRMFKRNPKPQSGKYYSRPDEVGVHESVLKIWEDAAFDILSETECDMVVFGHTHSATIQELARGKWYVNTGDWVDHSNYVEFTRESVTLKDWQTGATISAAELYDQPELVSA